MISASRTLNQMFYPLIVAANAIPKVALAPLLLLSFGLGISSKVVIVFLVCFFPIVVSSYAGFTSTPADLTELARALSASRLQTFVKVRFPSALPQIFVGPQGRRRRSPRSARSSARWPAPCAAWATNCSPTAARVAPPEGFAAVILLSILGVALFYLVVAVERLVIPMDQRLKPAPYRLTEPPVSSAAASGCPAPPPRSTPAASAPSAARG